MDAETEGATITRKAGTHLRVPVLPEEAALIKERARQVNLSVAGYLRNLGMGYEPKSTMDHSRVADLAKINADQGRLGGLLKMWLSNEERFLGFDGEKTRATIYAVLQKIDKNQDDLSDIVRIIQRGP